MNCEYERIELSRKTEKDTLEDPAEQVETTHPFTRVIQVGGMIDPQNDDAVKVATHDSHEVCHDGQRGDQEDTGQ